MAMAIPEHIREFFRHDADKVEAILSGMTPAEQALVASLAKPRNFKDKEKR